ncbi:DNA-processing protein DprA [soil metagenome]
MHQGNDIVNSTEIKHIWILKQVEGLGNTRIRLLINHFGSAEKIFEQELKTLTEVDNFNKILASSILNIRNRFSELENKFVDLLENCEKKKIRIISYICNDYPANLKEIYDAPVILFYRGNLHISDRYSIAVVGGRFPTDYGILCCQKFTNDLCDAGIPVISGMAKGIDSISHYESCKRGNLNYAILGSGVDIVYPPENSDLYQKIIETGAVISEYAVGSKAEPANFPARNRIISGISLGTLIVECGVKSGALITSTFALEQNKEVFAIPGNINSRLSGGTNNLIKKGQAKLVTCVEDILEELKIPLEGNITCYENQKQSQELNMFEQQIIDILSSEPVHIDYINEKTELPISQCLFHLLNLEFKGAIKQYPGKYFIKL